MPCPRRWYDSNGDEMVMTMIAKWWYIDGAKVIVNRDTDGDGDGETSRDGG